MNPSTVSPTRSVGAESAVPQRDRSESRARRGRAVHEPPAGPAVLVMRGNARFTAGLERVAEPVAVRRFPNGELHVHLSVPVEGRDCVVVGSVSPPPGNVERLTMVAHSLMRAGARRVTALIPYLAYARQDRAAANESLGLRWLGEVLSASGVGAVVTVDVHSPAADQLMGIPVRSLSPAMLMAQALTPSWRSDVTFVAPDEGARDRCTAVATAAGASRPIVYARKQRTAAGITHTSLEGTPSARVVVVDDILDTGGTLLSCCRLLRAAGAQKIGVVVTHGLFTGDAWRPLVDGVVDELWITDTVMARSRPPRVRVIATSPLLARALKQIED